MQRSEQLHLGIRAVQEFAVGQKRYPQNEDEVQQVLAQAKTINDGLK